MQPAPLTAAAALLLSLLPRAAMASASTTVSQCWWLTSPYSGRLAFEQAWYGRYLIASIVATAVCFATCLLALLPACCGVWSNRRRSLRALSALLGTVAGGTMFIPLILGLVKRSNYVNEYCDHCYCPDTTWAAGAHLMFEDVMSDYSQGFGFLVLIFGVATLVLSFLSCCRCCGPLRENVAAQQKQAGAAAVAPEV